MQNTTECKILIANICFVTVNSSINIDIHFHIIGVRNDLFSTCD